jgi:hypothetical protein
MGGQEILILSPFVESFWGSREIKGVASTNFKKAGINSGVVPQCEVAMYWDVKTVNPMSDYRIYVEVEDGRKGIFDLKPYLDRGVFRELKDIHYFNRVGILFGAVTWPNEQDIAPETLLAKMLPVDLNN